MSEQSVVRLHLRASELRAQQRQWRGIAERLGSQDTLTTREREELRIALRNVRELALALQTLRRKS